MAAVATPAAPATVYALPGDGSAFPSPYQHTAFYDATTKNYYPLAGAGGAGALPQAAGVYAMAAEPMFQTSEWFIIGFTHFFHDDVNN